MEVLRIRRSQLESSVTCKFVKVLKWLPTKQSCLALVSIEVKTYWLVVVIMNYACLSAGSKKDMDKMLTELEANADEMLSPEIPLQTAVKKRKNTAKE